MTAIIDYGLGNLYSIVNMLHHIGEESVITSDKYMIGNADRLILPGVGKFDEGMGNLERTGLQEVIRNEAKSGKAILGICLGMQLLGINSEEGKKEGLSLIPFRTVRFDLENVQSLKVPHMGWERVVFTSSDCPLTSGLDGRQRYYFVHSYHAVCEEGNVEIVSCDYGYCFTAGVRKRNVYGVQFHPEKSHRYGMALLGNFVRCC
ncbi:MAG: imidazole glycerol phosphate synthase subunit HisH [Lachnospiraceae bacterium]|jgi:glutamine amidotransferase|nr:imidazole glycerol phosphate synthase subunit HisH [Lachnospiraceae bacterium]